MVDVELMVEADKSMELHPVYYGDIEIAHPTQLVSHLPKLSSGPRLMAKSLSYASCSVRSKSRQCP